MRSNQTYSGLFLAVLLFGSLQTRADEAPPLKVDLDYASKNVFRGVDRAGASAQTTLEVSQGNFQGQLWTSQPFKQGQQGELNLAAAYAWHAPAGFKLEAIATNYWFSGGPADATRYSFEAGLAATLAPIQGITPTLAYYHDIRLRADTWQVSLAHSIALTQLGAFLDLNIFGGYSAGNDWRPDASGPHRSDSYGYWGAEAQLPYNLGYLVPHTTLVTGLHYTDTRGLSPVNGPFGRSDGRNFWVTLGVSLDF